MKAFRAIVTTVLATYLLVVPVIFYGLHAEEHKGEEVHEIHTQHQDHTGACLSHDEVECSLCDLFKKHDSFFRDSSQNPESGPLAILSTSFESDLPAFDATSYYLRGPPVSKLN